MKTTLKKLSIPKPKGGYDELYVDDFVTKEELAALKDTIYKLHFDKEEVTDLHPFYIKSLEDENVVYSSSVSCRLSNDAANMEYSYDGIWHNLAEVESVTLNKDERVYFRYIGEDYLQGNELISNPTKTFEVGGDLRSVIYGDMTRENTGNGHYRQLFYDLSNLVSAKNLKLGAELMSEECCFDMFCGCTSLVEAPELPATTLSIGCYRSMFQGCTSLVVAPKLPATKLAHSCYNYMFTNCQSLISAPELPATELANYCYSSMFRGCTNLTQAPKLLATTLASECYAYMFEGCTSLVNAPELPATTLANGCYTHMFEGCTSLVNAPVLPATKLISLCYNTMFAGCSSLEKVEILAESGIENIYTPLAHMFNGCENLKRVFCNLKEPLIGDDTGTSPTNEWLNNVSPTGKFIKTKGLEWELGVSGIPEGWEVEDWHDDYFYLECLDDEGDITLGQEFGLEDAPAEYTRNHINWTSTEEGMVISLVKGERVYLRRAYGTAFRSMSSNSPIFTTESRIKIGGNVDKLMYDFKSESVVLTEACYSCLFNSEDITCNIVDASELVLPAKELARYCYYYMFACCTNLVAAPKLPAMILAESCYGSMFKQCTSLTTAPELPATTLVTSCYSYMFYGCKKLSYVKCNVIKYGYSDFQTNTRYWLSGVSSSGTFVKNGCFSDWTSGSSGIPSGWEVEDMLVNFKPTEKITPSGRVAFYGEEYSFVCTINKAEGHLLYISKDGENWMLLPAYEAMPITQGETIYICGRMTNDFSSTNYTQFAMTGKIAASGNCNALWNYEDLNASLKAYCGYSMFKQCTSLTTAPELPATTLADYCYSGMFTQCTSLTTAPALPATTLAIYCYNSMFSGCTALTQAPELPATTLADWCYYKMFSSCKSLTTAPELPATTLAYQCYNSMFSYCTSLNYVRALFTTKELFTVSAGGGSVAYHYTVNWLSGVSEVGTFEKNKNAAWSVNYYLTGGSGIPEGWTINEV